MTKSARSSRKASKAATEPRLGIFWLVNGELLTDSLPLRECENDGDFRNYPGSHIDVWRQWQRIGKAPVESVYEEYPRGRVTQNAKADTYALLADKCILKHKDLIAAIRREFHLPKKTSVGGDKTSVGGDSHYRCFHCLHGNALDEE
jgi:hypothetical protein